MVDLLRAVGPGADEAYRSQFEGYSPYSRINEQVQNCHIATHLYPTKRNRDSDTPVSKEAWASAVPGTVCLMKLNEFQNMTAATGGSAAVIVSAYQKKVEDEENFQFAGVVRTPSVCTSAGGMMELALSSPGDQFTMFVEGCIATLINNSGGVIKAGQTVYWTFDRGTASDNYMYTKSKHVSERIRIVGLEAAEYHRNAIGRCLNGGANGSSIDVVLDRPV